jgi:hypothetical protein
MKQIKRLLSIFMAFILLYSLGPNLVYAEEGTVETADEPVQESSISKSFAYENDFDEDERDSAAAVIDDTEYDAQEELPDNADNLYIDNDDAEGVYVNGETGDDKNSGLTDALAVKTFDRAKEILNANPDLDTIYVTGKLTVTGEEKTIFNLEGRRLARYPGYKGVLIELDKDSRADLTLTDIVIDGSCLNGTNDVQSLVKVNTDTYLTIDSGTVLKNNDVSLYNTDYAGYRAGGAVYSVGTVVMNDGVVQNCSAVNGGGIYCSRGSFTLNGGVIKDNRNYQTMTDNYGNYIIPSGGGVMVNGPAVMTMNGGTISGNEAYCGGGISVGGNWYIDPSIDSGTKEADNLIMNGGTIENNTAVSCGGGIFIQSLFTATLKAGTINKNHCQGQSEGYFGGGGIYVNGGKEGFTSGHLQLFNVVVADNTAELEGGGIAGFYTSDTEYYASDGGIIYNNSADGRKSDILVSNCNGTYAIPSGNTRKYITEYMPGGEPYCWQYTETGHFTGINYLQNNSCISIYTDKKEDDEEVQAFKSLAAVFITGNTSETCGGGIGSNGDVVIGESPVMLPGTVNISVTRIWDDNDNEDGRPKKVRIWLLRNEERVSCLEFKNSDTDGTLKFTNLPIADEEGREYDYTIEEDTDCLDGRYIGIAEKKTNAEWVVTNIPAGSIEISSTVSGTGASRTKNFVYKITLDNQEIQGRYGDITFERGAAVIMLKDGESRYAVLPADINYTVEEIDSHDYSATVNNHAGTSIQGTIVYGETQTAEFNNYRDGDPEDPEKAETRENPPPLEAAEKSTLIKKKEYII